MNGRLSYLCLVATFVASTVPGGLYAWYQHGGGWGGPNIGFGIDLTPRSQPIIVEKEVDTSQKDREILRLREKIIRLKKENSYLHKQLRACRQ